MPKGLKSSLRNGISIPTKTCFCNECSDKRICKKSNLVPNENSELGASLILRKRQVLNEFGHMLSYFKEKDDLFVIVRLR